MLDEMLVTIFGPDVGETSPADALPPDSANASGGGIGRVVFARHIGT